jgi:hypothetical protein
MTDRMIPHESPAQVTIPLGDSRAPYQQALESAIPDLRGVPVDRLAELAAPVLGKSIDLYLQRLQGSSVLLNSFSSSI